VKRSRAFASVCNCLELWTFSVIYVNFTIVLYYVSFTLFYVWELQINCRWQQMTRSKSYLYERWLVISDKCRKGLFEWISIQIPYLLQNYVHYCKAIGIFFSGTPCSRTAVSCRAAAWWLYAREQSSRLSLVCVSYQFFYSFRWNRICHLWPFVAYFNRHFILLRYRRARRVAMHCSAATQYCCCCCCCWLKLLINTLATESSALSVMIYLLTALN